MVIDSHAKNQVNIFKHLGRKSAKLDSDGLTDRRTERKLKVLFGFAGRGLFKAAYIFFPKLYLNQTHMS